MGARRLEVVLGAGDVEDGGCAVGLDEEVVDVQLRRRRVGRGVVLQSDRVEALALVKRHVQELRGAFLPVHALASWARASTAAQGM